MIPKNLIEKAKSRHACPQAIEWLERSPRSFEDLISCNTYWAEWAVRKLCSLSTLKAYNKVKAPALRSYEEATASARKVYEDAVAPAWKAYNKVKASALRSYNEATAPAWKAYNKVKASARKVYEDAVAPAWKAYNEATAPALLTALKTLEVK